MGKKKLISMIQYLDNLQSVSCPRSVPMERELKIKQWWDIIRYKDFLKRTLELWMFIPCDKEGKPLAIPSQYQLAIRGELGTDKRIEAEQYQEAKERVFFEGGGINTGEFGSFGVTLNGYQFAYWKNTPKYWVGMDKTIEDLVGLDLTLSKTGNSLIK